jgi:hypothetical protein
MRDATRYRDRDEVTSRAATANARATCEVARLLKSLDPTTTTKTNITVIAIARA